MKKALNDCKLAHGEQPEYSSGDEVDEEDEDEKYEEEFFGKLNHKKRGRQGKKSMKKGGETEG